MVLPIWGRSLGLLPDAQPCPLHRGLEYRGWVEARQWGVPSALLRRVSFRESWRGHLRQGRFVSFVMDEACLLATAPYVKRNPVRAGLATSPWVSRWSSARAQLSGQDDVLVNTRPLLQMVGNWRESLSEDSPPEELRLLRRHESTGRSLGNDEFARRLEEASGRTLRKTKPGAKPAQKRNQVWCPRNSKFAEFVKEEDGVTRRIMSGLWEVGGGGLTDPADAAIYLVRFGDKAALIDAGTGRGHSRLKKNIAECLPPDVQLEYLLLTHCHYDHTGGAEEVRKDFGCRIVAHELDAIYLESGDSDVTAASWYGAEHEPLSIDIKLQGEESTLTIGTGSVTAIHWPGHSPGSVVYTTRIEDKLVLFGQDIHGPIHPALLSDEKLYQASLAKLLDLGADILLEGHFGIVWTREEVREYIQSFMR